MFGQELGRLRIQYVRADVTHLYAEQQEDQSEKQELVTVQVHAFCRVSEVSRLAKWRDGHSNCNPLLAPSFCFVLQLQTTVENRALVGSVDRAGGAAWKT